MYILATQGTREEDFARRRMRHLTEKGVRVTERTVDGDADGESAVGDGVAESE
jgi:DNA excision repair protein ERCC-3